MNNTSRIAFFIAILLTIAFVIGLYFSFYQYYEYEFEGRHLEDASGRAWSNYKATIVIGSTVILGVGLIVSLMIGITEMFD